MAYATWSEVAETMQGEERLKDSLLPRIETASVHPWFDQQSAVADRMIDSALSAAGFETPLASIVDPVLKHTAIGLRIGLITEASSSREQWMIDLYNAALAYLKKIEKGTVVPIGLEEDSSPTTAQLILGGGHNETPIFDIDDPQAEALGVFARLGAGPRWPWRP